MSTFFDRLTNQNDTPALSSMELTGARDPLKRPPPRHTPDVQDDGSASATPHAQSKTNMPLAAEELPEEEGELTVDIYDRGERIVIQSTVAGVKPEHLDVSITDDSVTIRGRRERIEDVPEENYFYKELFWGAFSRSVILPEEIEQEAAQAHLQHGLLTIYLPKKRKGTVQKLKVRVV